MAADPTAVPSMQVKLLSEKGKAPTRGSAFAAGYDIYTAQDTTIPARGQALVDTDIAIAVPAGTCESPSLLHQPHYSTLRIRDRESVAET